MSGELERMAKAFRRQEPIVPDKKARHDAINAAVEHFSQEKITTRQGMQLGDRLREQGNKFFANPKWRHKMQIALPKLKFALAGGASLAVLALVATNLNVIEPVVFSPSDFKSLDDPVASAGQKKQDTKFDKISKPLGETKITDTNRPTVRKPKSTMDRSILSRPLVEHEMMVAPKLRSAPRTPSAAEPVADAAAIGIGRVQGLSRVQSSKKALAQIDQDTTSGHYQDKGRDRFDKITPNPVKLTREEPLSTFSADVDTASYSFVRAALNRGVLPQKNAVRVEEMINYFTYDYAVPDDRSKPFKTNVSIMPTPWNEQTMLMRIGIKGYQLPKIDRPKTNLVFLIDTSGSMNVLNKLPLLVHSFKLLLSSLKPDDTVAIVTYAGGAGTVLEPTKVAEKGKIIASLDGLTSGGSTAGASGIHQAYQLAESQFESNGVNRVILATDGDFNVGITSTEELKNYVERKRKSGISLSVLGFGHGNYNDALMQKLAQNGNGNAAYIDTLNEARKVLVDEAASTLFTIARDVKLQVEFNSQTISEYRLIGYETRKLQREDFNNDKVDAGDIGAGHSVTAIYELTPVASSKKSVDALRYSGEEKIGPAKSASEYAFVKIRYKLPDSSSSQLISTPVTPALKAEAVAGASKDTRFASAVAAFGQLLRGGTHTGNMTYDDVVALAQSAKGDDRFGYRAEFINLVRLAKSASAMQP